MAAAVDKAYLAIRDGIVNGAFPPGSHLTAQSLASATAMSRTPVREAMRRLHAEGLIQFIPHRGAFVRQLDRKDEYVNLESGSSDDDAPVDDSRIEEERRLMYVAITRAQRSLHLNWCKKRKRARETVVCEATRFIAEMLLDDAPPPTAEEKPLSPKDRMAMLKAMLQKT